MHPNFNNWDEYDIKVIYEIAQHIVSPGLIESVLEKVVWPVRYIIKKATESNIYRITQITDIIQKKISEWLISTIKLAKSFYNEDKILNLYWDYGIRVKSLNEISVKTSLEIKDKVARAFNFENKLFLTMEGIAAGVGSTLTADTAALVIITTDIGLSITLLSRQACQIAAAYGYPASAPENILHILNSMAPIYDEKKGIIPIKRVLYSEILKAVIFLQRTSTKISEEVLEKEFPALIRFINKLAQRIGIILTEKELGILIPVIGILANGGLNFAFQQAGHRNAMDYFRYLELCSKYGEEEVRRNLDFIIQELR